MWRFTIKWCSSIERYLEIRLIEVEPITDMSDIFKQVKALLSLPDISNLNTSKVTKMRFLFIIANHWHIYHQF